MFAIVVSDVIGLWFVNHYSKIILMPLGGYYIYVLLCNYVVTNRKIEILIYYLKSSYTCEIVLAKSHHKQYIVLSTLQKYIFSI